jgi:hypothetical protein
VLGEKVAKVHEKNENLHIQVQNFKVDKQRMDEEKVGILGNSMLKYEERILKF